MEEEKVQKAFQKLLVLLAVVAIFVLAACGTSKDNAKEESTKKAMLTVLTMQWGQLK